MMSKDSRRMCSPEFRRLKELEKKLHHLEERNEIVKRLPLF